LLAAAVMLVTISCGTDNDIDLSISETEEELVVSASYPARDSERVHDYIKSKLNMTEITDLRDLDGKDYQSPDTKMNFHIKSRDGYLKIVLDRRENTSRSYKVLKETAEGLQVLFKER
jgi:hypothetical protein